MSLMTPVGATAFDARSRACFIPNHPAQERSQVGQRIDLVRRSFQLPGEP
jgi:hypothetical protein